MTKLYINRWVISRGIIVVEGTKPERWSERSKRLRSWARPPGCPYTRAFIIGDDTFLSLKEAHRDAHRRIREHLNRRRQELWYAEQAHERLLKGELQVHEAFGSITECQAFLGLDVAAGPWSPRYVERPWDD